MNTIVLAGPMSSETRGSVTRADGLAEVIRVVGRRAFAWGHMVSFFAGHPDLGRKANCSLDLFDLAGVVAVVDALEHGPLAAVQRPEE